MGGLSASATNKSLWKKVSFILCMRVVRTMEIPEKLGILATVVTSSKHWDRRLVLSYCPWLKPTTPEPHITALVGVPAVSLPIQLPATVPAKAAEDGWELELLPHTQGTRKELLALAWPHSDHCKHMGSEPADIKVLSLSHCFQINKIISFFKVEPKIAPWIKDSHFNKWCFESWVSAYQSIKQYPHFTPCTIISQ